MRNRFDLFPARALTGASVPARVAASVLALGLAVGCVALPARAGSLTVALNHSTRLKLAGPAASVVVGNPDVADVTVVDSRTVFVSGRGAGSTDVAVLDPLGRMVFSGDVHVSSQAGLHVAVHRGVGSVSDLACDPTCVAVKAPNSNGRVVATANNAAGAAPGISESMSNSGVQAIPVVTQTTLFTH